jgi:hypothetical protein
LNDRLNTFSEEFKVLNESQCGFRKQCSTIDSIFILYSFFECLKSKNKIDPGKPGDEDLYELSEKEKASIPKVCSSLDQALAALDKDREFISSCNTYQTQQDEGKHAMRLPLPF